MFCLLGLSFCHALLAVALVFCWNLFRAVSRMFLRLGEDLRWVEGRFTAEGLGLTIKQNIDNFLGARIGKKVQGPHRVLTNHDRGGDEDVAKHKI